MTEFAITSPIYNASFQAWYKGNGPLGPWLAYAAFDGTGGTMWDASRIPVPLLPQGYLAICRNTYTSYTDTDYSYFNSFLSFDTSIIGPGATIHSAQLVLTKKTHYGTLYFLSTLSADWYTGAWTSGPPALEDTAVSFAGTAILNANIVGWQEDETREFELNDPQGGINPTGRTRLILGTNDEWPPYGTTTPQRIDLYDMTAGGEEKGPKLKVTFVSGGNLCHVVISEGAGVSTVKCPAKASEPLCEVEGKIYGPAGRIGSGIVRYALSHAAAWETQTESLGALGRELQEGRIADDGGVTLWLPPQTALCPLGEAQQSEQRVILTLPSGAEVGLEIPDAPTADLAEIAHGSAPTFSAVNSLCAVRLTGPPFATIRVRLSEPGLWRRGTGEVVLLDTTIAEVRLDALGEGEALLAPQTALAGLHGAPAPPWELLYPHGAIILAHAPDAATADFSDLSIVTVK